MRSASRSFRVANKGLGQVIGFDMDVMLQTAARWTPIRIEQRRSSFRSVAWRCGPCLSGSNRSSWKQFLISTASCRPWRALELGVAALGGRIKILAVEFKIFRCGVNDGQRRAHNSCETVEKKRRCSSCVWRSALSEDHQLQGLLQGRCW